MKTITWIGTISTLAGTTLGFILSEVARWERARTRYKKMIKSLIAELTEIHTYLSGLKVEKAREEGFVEIRNPLLTDVYRSVKGEIIGEINENTLVKLQQCYLEIGKLNSRPFRASETLISRLNKLITEVISELRKELRKPLISL